MNHVSLHGTGNRNRPISLLSRVKINQNLIDSRCDVLVVETLLTDTNPYGGIHNVVA